MHVRLNALADGHATHDLRVIDYRWYKAFFGTAIRFYRRPPFPVSQVVHPVDERQPSAWLPPDEHPAGVWTQDL